MAIITISRGSYSRGKEVAEKVASRLGYECLSRDVVLETAKQLHIPEVKLIRALHDAPSILDRLIGGREKYVADFRRVLLHHLQKNNVVYHGLAGQFFLKGIPHVLKVRILANKDQRVLEEMARENIPREEALRIITTDDEERRQWSLHLYGIDTWDPDLYNMVLKIGKLTIDSAVEIILSAVKQPCFQTTAESRQKMKELAFIAELQTQVDESSIVNVALADGELSVTLKAPAKKRDDLEAKIRRIADGLPDVKSVSISFGPLSPF